MIKIIPFKANHAYCIVENVTKPFIESMESHERDGDSLTAIYGDKFFCCGGVKVIWDGVGEVWTVNSSHIKDHPLTFHKLILQWLRLFTDKYDLDRVQAVVEATNSMNKKWIESLGFKAEGLMRKYHGGKDYIMYARVR